MYLHPSSDSKYIPTTYLFFYRWRNSAWCLYYTFWY